MTANLDSSHYVSPGDDDSEEYRAAFRRQVFQLLEWGYQRMDASKFHSSQEEDITGELAKEINALVQDRNYPKWVGRFYAHEEYRITEDQRTGKYRKRLDIVFIYIKHGPRPSFPFEAKRLSKNGHSIGQYLGPSGLGEFLSGSYGRDSSQGGMIGYVQYGTPEQWAKKAAEKLNDNPNIYQLCSEKRCMYVKIVDDMNLCYLSVHHRNIGNSPISIYHSFLNFLRK